MLHIRQLQSPLAASNVYKSEGTEKDTNWERLRQTSLPLSRYLFRTNGVYAIRNNDEDSALHRLQSVKPPSFMQRFLQSVVSKSTPDSPTPVRSWFCLLLPKEPVRRDGGASYTTPCAVHFKLRCFLRVWRWEWWRVWRRERQRRGRREWIGRWGSEGEIDSGRRWGGLSALARCDHTRCWSMNSSLFSAKKEKDELCPSSSVPLLRNLIFQFLLYFWFTGFISVPVW